MGQLEKLIQQGHTFTFKNNSYTVSYGKFSKASDALLAWVADVEDFIRNNYGEESNTFKLFQTFDRRELNGNDQADFEKQIKIINRVLNTCRSIPIKKESTKADNLVIALSKNLYFLTFFIVLLGLSFTLGLHFSSSKYNKEKSEFQEITKLQENELYRLKLDAQSKDSTILVLNKKPLYTEDSLANKK